MSMATDYSKASRDRGDECRRTKGGLSKVDEIAFISYSLRSAHPF